MTAPRSDADQARADLDAVAAGDWSLSGAIPKALRVLPNDERAARSLAIVVQAEAALVAAMEDALVAGWARRGGLAPALDAMMELSTEPGSLLPKFPHVDAPTAHQAAALTRYKEKASPILRTIHGALHDDPSLAPSTGVVLYTTVRRLLWRHPTGRTFGARLSLSGIEGGTGSVAGDVAAMRRLTAARAVIETGAQGHGDAKDREPLFEIALKCPSDGQGYRQRFHAPNLRTAIAMMAEHERAVDAFRGRPFKGRIVAAALNLSPIILDAATTALLKADDSTTNLSP